MTTLPPQPQMQRAFARRDASFDGLFFVAVRTTGIFCRPTCPARRPKPENIEYFATARDALHSGYRACKRCRPLDNGGAPPEWVERLMDEVDRAPGERMTDTDLRAMSIEPARARRYFKAHYGMTFHAYHRARRMGRALKEIRGGGDLLETGLNSGFDSSSGFREAFARVFGTPPGKGRDATCLLARWLDTPLGAMLAVASDDGLCLLEFVDRRAIEHQIETLRKRMQATIVPGDNAHLDTIEDELGRYFAGSLKRFRVPLVLPGTPFQQQVWQRLQEIPFGRTLSYAELAEDIGRPGAQRAVGRANGDNRLAIIIPCHRAVRSDGTLCGYGGGLWRKKWLLEHERGNG
ncbi:MAG: methylated-DNA--[protein]-cysteine S-methyltransferase [Phycisphaerales bacterium]|nr:MAG: methylated-DNA--[protein]-cysteine S-methyltransferase [Phycisphaerales bacterium]